MHFDLSTPEGRARAQRDLMWRDHGFFRLWFQNALWISVEMARANQPSPRQIGIWAQKGIRTVINLRGGMDTGFHALEREACAAHGLVLENFTVKSRDVHPPEVIFAARDLFERIAYPALMHCKSGADRAGFMAALYLHFRRGQRIEVARRQLSLKYLHVASAKTGLLDYFFDCYLDYARDHPASFSDWVRDVYDPAALKASFMDKRLGTILVDRILRRE